MYTYIAFCLKIIVTIQCISMYTYSFLFEDNRHIIYTYTYSFLFEDNRYPIYMYIL